MRLDRGTDVDVWREQVRQMPGVVVHRPQPPVPFVPDMRVINVEHKGKLIDDDDEPCDQQSPDL